ncbi:hypothetical protein Tco_1317161, partial [Tanacetum coccineum]
MSFLSTSITLYGYCLLAVSSSRSSAVLRQMTYLVASSTLDSARTYLMQGALSQRTMFPKYPMVAGISPEVSCLLVLAAGGVIVTNHALYLSNNPMLCDASSKVFEASSSNVLIILLGVPVGPVFLLGLLSLVIDATCAFRAEEMPSLISCWM